MCKLRLRLSLPRGSVAEAAICLPPSCIGDAHAHAGAAAAAAAASAANNVVIPTHTLLLGRAELLDRTWKILIFWLRPCLFLCGTSAGPWWRWHRRWRW